MDVRCNLKLRGEPFHKALHRCTMQSTSITRCVFVQPEKSITPQLFRMQSMKKQMFICLYEWTRPSPDERNACHLKRDWNGFGFCCLFFFCFSFGRSQSIRNLWNPYKPECMLSSRQKRDKPNSNVLKFNYNHCKFHAGIQWLSGFYINLWSPYQLDCVLSLRHKGGNTK